MPVNQEPWVSDVDCFIDRWSRSPSFNRARPSASYATVAENSLATARLSFTRPTDTDMRLQQLAVARTGTEAAVRAAVTEFRAAGASWTDVAACLGVTRQAARQRYA